MFLVFLLIMRFNRAFILVSVFLFLFQIANAAVVEVDTDIYGEETVFTYVFSFGDEDFTSFSVERPKDAELMHALLEDGSDVDYFVAGDFFIFNPEGIRNKNIFIKFKSKETSERINKHNAFSTFVKFNFPLERLEFRVKIGEGLGEIEEIFPRDFEISSEGRIVWTLENVSGDTLFWINFKKVGNGQFLSQSGLWNYAIVFLLILPVVLFGFLIFLLKKGPAEKAEKHHEKHEKEEEKKKEIEGEKKEEEVKKEDKTIKITEIVDKYLTDNEKEVVNVVRENDGISQYDIMNYLPKITKSNLSKIISKLHNRKFLKRIRVGKVNKIYLGEKLTGSDSNGIETENNV